MKTKYKKLDYNTEDLESLSNSELKKLGDYWLRNHLLSKQESTYYFCPLKQKSYSADNIHVGHYIDRANMWTRYDLQNCHLVSSQSNMWDAQINKEGYKSLHHYDYEQFLVSEYGNDVISILREKAKNKDIFRKENYIEVINKFRSNE
jgi:hypothetical protein